MPGKDVKIDVRSAVMFVEQKNNVILHNQNFGASSSGCTDQHISLIGKFG